MDEKMVLRFDSNFNSESGTIDMSIVQILNEKVEEVERWRVRTFEAETRSALMALGWTPPAVSQTERQEALNLFIDMLHEKMTERKAGDDGALNDDQFLEWLESKAEPFFPYTIHGGQVVWGTGELSQ